MHFIPIHITKVVLYKSFIIHITRVNVPIVVQFVVVQMYFNGFKVSETTISEYFNT